jgi:hypothetical protein
MEYSLNKKKVRYEPLGEKIPGNESVLLQRAIDLTRGRSWSEVGYVVEKLFDIESYENFKIKTRELLISLWRKAGLTFPDHIKLEHYHHSIQTEDSHLAAIEETKAVPTVKFPFSINRMEKRISQICETELVAHNPFDQQSIFHFRIVRPNSRDNNPLHRDVWLEDYANCINLYIPVAGSNSDSSLSIIPGSHHWPENRIERTKKGALIEGIKFNVPAVTVIKGEYTIIRPDPRENEALIFSPYLIHGGAVNLNSDQTRISIELRLWKKNQL